MQSLMQQVFIWFWTLMVFGSICWYGFLLFYVGYKGALDILRMAQRFDTRPDDETNAGDGS